MRHICRLSSLYQQTGCDSLNNLNHFCQNVRRIRVEKGITQKNLAIQVGVQQKTIACMESGERFPSIAKIYRVADVLDVDVFEFFKAVE